MPKRRTSKRRTGGISREAELAAWSGVFNCGTDFFEDLPKIGVETNRLDEPDDAVFEAAWRRLGLAFLRSATAENGRTGQFAISRFGDPDTD